MASNQFPMKLEAASAAEQQQQQQQQKDAQDMSDEEMRCQYSSKRCENRRTNKKSGGLHKFCAMHREKANRNQMRLDHRRRVTKLQQKELQRQQQQQAFQQAQMQRSHVSHVSASAAMAAGQSFHHQSRARPQQRGLDMRTPIAAARAMPAQTFQTFGLGQQQTRSVNVPPGNLFNDQDLQILEALLFSSDEEAPTDATKMHMEPHPHLVRSASYVNV